MSKEVHKFSDENLKWVAGPEGSLRIRELAKAFHLKKAASLGKSAYSPWMTYTERLDHFRNLIDQPVTTGFVTDETSLARIKEALTNESGLVTVMKSPEFKVFIDPQCLAHKPWLISEFENSFRILKQVMPWMGPLADEIIQYFIPVEYEGLPSKGRAAFSQHQTKGIVYLTLPQPEENSTAADDWKRWGQNAIDMAHEIGHNALMFYLTADKLTTSDPKTLVFSGARGIERPVYPSIHAAMALSYMLATAERLSRCSEFPTEVLWVFADKTKEYAMAFAKNLESLRERCQFTTFGEQIIKDFELQLGSLTFGPIIASTKPLAEPLRTARRNYA